ncbi:hypothetical protein ORI89_11120 [Sphingobacterium sp. UT-1RO-CII-1]|uniref:hypothetical protein n=1 Tax=Sphingobacterium sp. UT-1RO-CII-1 TaxID=2995225 RepID=UPI00227A4D28|nr:hypothetical protein [Sphingobacterium sp. UT-1RO-CII-1]MCY4780204.1 hypothetical protein [Sphingobacterium sp. UT-1RO-CII-1]
MFQDLKNSTFKANEVFLRAVFVLRKHYFSIAGLCFLLFVTSNLSSYLAFTTQETLDFSFRVLLCLLFLTLFFGTQLVLIKRAILLARGIEHSYLKNYIPSTRQFISFLLGFVVYSLLLGIVYFVTSILTFPLVYMGASVDTVSYEVNPFLTGMFMLFVLMRITFFPYFIVDKEFNLFRSFRMSLALTRGNVMKIFLLVLALGTTYLLQVLSEYLSYFILAKIFSFINTFVVIPSVSIVMAMAYNDMMDEYSGEEDPKLLENII